MNMSKILINKEIKMMFKKARTTKKKMRMKVLRATKKTNSQVELLLLQVKI